MSAADEMRRADLAKATKRQLAEMYRSTFRFTIRPSLSEVLNGHTKDQIIERLLAVQDRLGVRDA